MEDEGVIVEQGQRIGGEFVQQRIPQNQRRLRAARRLLLAEDVGYVVGAKGMCRGSLFYGARHSSRSVLTDEFEQFGQLA